MVGPVWLVSQLIPPALLTYFGTAYWRCMTEVAPYVSRQHGSVAGVVYRIASSALLPTISILFLRLYFLPRNQSLPNKEPPPFKPRRIIHECLSPEEAKIVELARRKATTTGSDHTYDNSDTHEPKVNRCWKGKCGGRWKPARARHCSECGVCRAGFDHHCAFFANCLTTPYMPCFLLTLVLTPLAVVEICWPLFVPFGHRFMEAFRLSRSDARFSWWWNWWPSWIVAGGPIGRYAGGVVLAWKELDRRDGAGLFRLGNGILVALGLMLSLIACGLAYSTVTLIRHGHLTIDRERQKSHTRARHAIEKLRAASQPIPADLEESLRRFTDIHHFYVPVPDDPDRGHIIATLPTENPYDFGAKGNWRLIMGSGWGWLNPLRAIRRGMDNEIYNWPIAPGVEARLIAESKRHSETSAAQ